MMMKQHDLYNLKNQQELFPSVPILNNKNITQFLMQQNLIMIDGDYNCAVQCQFYDKMIIVHKVNHYLIEF